MKKINIEKYADIAPQFYNSDFSKLLEKYLKKANYSSIIDCGCGDGNILNILKKSGYLQNKKCYAVDLSKKRVELVKKISNNINVAADSAEQLRSIKNKSIDFFISTQVIEHVDDKKMIDTIDRVTSSGSFVYLTTVFKKWYGWYFYRCNGKWVIDPTHLREYTTDRELLRFIDKDRFDILENKKTLLSFPIIDFFVKRMSIENRYVYNNKFMNFLRKIKVPIPGYYSWEIVFKKR